MSIIMTESERTSFLADVHVGVLAVARDGRGPLVVPVWYAYEPGGELQVWMERGSVKFRAIDAVGRGDAPRADGGPPVQVRVGRGAGGEY